MGQSDAGQAVAPPSLGENYRAAHEAADVQTLSSPSQKGLHVHSPGAIEVIQKTYRAGAESHLPLSTKHRLA